MKGTTIWSLVWEDLTCHRATKPEPHSYCFCALELRNCSCRAWGCGSYWSPWPQLESSPRLAAARESPEQPQRPSTAKNKQIIFLNDRVNLFDPHKNPVWCWADIERNLRLAEIHDFPCGTWCIIGWSEMRTCEDLSVVLLLKSRVQFLQHSLYICTITATVPVSHTHAFHDITPFVYMTLQPL